MSNYAVHKLDHTFTIYQLTEADTDSSVSICPDRGAIATQLRLRGKELFYLDKATFMDPVSNIRGGNPILFPISGQLTDGQYEWEGHTYSMKNHGVARTNHWEVVSFGTDGAASLTVRLHSDASTLASYPFEFELEFTYILQGGKLRLEQQYRNLSGKPMPVYAGFHPYFATANKELVYETDATVYLDYNDGEIKQIDHAIDLSGKVESLTLLDARKPQISFSLAEDTRIKLSYSDVFKYVVLWSVEGKPFVCVEPWMAKTHELNRKEELPFIEAGSTLEAWLEIASE
ncbi:aldose epimerase [Paenibacillus sp. GCM10012307]|uniref:Aldose epimerase n=1 Tax=Paenibacillus roseus TaxID=2798579 RepID=A0A934J560_9BACL|nr:aldose epimerase [Paenibacillus roseus]MBJ6360996.1 aldose epimerase [Paenibacillus roseus]